VSADDLVTSNDLFGDLVDAPVEATSSERVAARVQPIRVQVPEPKSREVAAAAQATEPEASTNALAAEELKALLGVLGADEAAAPGTPTTPRPATTERGHEARTPTAPAMRAATTSGEALDDLEGFDTLVDGVMLDAPAPAPAPVAPPTPRAPDPTPPASVPARRARTPFAGGGAEFESLLDGVFAAPALDPSPSPFDADLTPPAIERTPADADKTPSTAPGAAEPAAAQVRFAARTSGAAPTESVLEIDLLGVATSAFEQPAPTPRRDAATRRRATRLVFGPYRLLERVAVGGMAEVFRAKRSGVEGFEKVVAVKRILPHLSDNKEFVDMFVDEAKMVAGLAHPNIVQIFDLGRLDESYFIAMEYVHGRDLRSIQKRARERDQRIPLDLSALIVSKVCAALEYAHRKKDDRGRPMLLVHRDVSPQNILITFEGEVKLTDFGIAKAASKATITERGSLRGKLLYMSPEQASGEPTDRRADLFALGIVFYELITGQRPFGTGSERSVLESVRECRVTPPRALNARIPERIEAVVMKALARDPDHRYQDAGEMARDLDRVLYERQVAAPELARLMEVLFDQHEREEQPGDDPSAGVEGNLDVEFEAPASQAAPAPADALTLDSLIKRFGVRS
jgi:serine/threonine protein kinase